MFLFERGWVISDGIKLYIDPISHFGQEIISTKKYEPIFAQELIDTICPGDSILDIGANEGFFSLLAARAAGPRGKVFAIEPIPELVEVINKNSKENGFDQVTVFPLAFSETAGEVKLNLSFSINSGASSLFDRKVSGTGQIQVRSERFDDWWLKLGRPHFNVVKIDCEGAELVVMRSAKKALRDHFANFIFLDFHECIIGLSGVWEIDDCLRDSGYELTELKSGVWCYHLPNPKNTNWISRIKRTVPRLRTN